MNYIRIFYDLSKQKVIFYYGFTDKIVDIWANKRSIRKIYNAKIQKMQKNRVKIARAEKSYHKLVEKAKIGQFVGNKTNKEIMLHMIIFKGKIS